MIQSILDKLRDKRIGVLCGGQSGEREVSLRSGQGVLDTLGRHGFEAVSVDPGPDLIGQLQEVGAKVAFNALHGGAGENGTIPALLDYAGIPYTGSGMVASAITMNKLITKRLLGATGLPTPDFVHVRHDLDLAEQVRAVISDLGLPVVTKPLAEGSSLGVSIPGDEDALREALAKLLDKYGEALVERFCDGTEITVGILGVDESLRALPVLELVPRKEFYDYEAKYTKGLTDLVAPARIPDEAADEAQGIAVRAHRELGCVGISRVDMHLDSAGQVWVHELNSVPGLTELSDVPAAAAAAGMSYDDVILEILTSATTRMQTRKQQTDT